MYNRIILPALQEALFHYKAITITGPRQSGKTTLVRSAFPDYVYLSLEDPDLRRIAVEDPRGLLNRYQNKNIIFDEIQRAPEITSYLQGIIDDPKNNSRFILTGSHSLLLLEAVKQSLAGRTRVFELLPLSLKELAQQKDLTLNELMFNGLYPRIHNDSIPSTPWLKDYFRLYVERDVREIININDLDQFERFVRLCSGRVGQIVNFSSLGNEAGITQPTASAWIGAIKSTYTCFTLAPHFNNFHKRIVKSPKLYFYDTGLLCYLLGIISPEQLEVHPLRGNIFENFVISELYKQKLNQGLDTNYYFWRDQTGNEADLVEDRGTSLYPIEIKCSSTFHPDFTKGIKYLNKLQSQETTDHDAGMVIYNGEDRLDYKGIEVRNALEFLKG